MPRRLVIQSVEWPYHVTARVNNRETFPGSLAYAWKTISSELYLQTITRKALVHTFVLMPNHFHLIISTPNSSISDTMREVMSSSTCIINAKNHRTGHLFGGRYRWSIITNPLYYVHAFKYAYRNPVKAGLSAYVGAYPYSTYGGLVGSSLLTIPISSPLHQIDRLIPTDIEQLDAWLNQPHKAEEDEAIKKALTRKLFKLPVKRHKKKVVDLNPAP